MANPHSVTLTPAQVEAVQRLQELGGGLWPRARVVEALLSSGGNEEMAANLLLGGFQ